MPAMKHSTSSPGNLRCLWPAALVMMATAAPLTGQTQPPAPPPPLGRVSSESGLELQSMDRTAKPCDDFYQFACGGWMANNPIPADRGNWGRFAELQERNDAVLRDILEAAAAGRDPATKQMGDYYAACMDSHAADAQGLSALDPHLKTIDGLKRPADLPEIVARLHTTGLSPSVIPTQGGAFFRFQAWQDPEDARVVRPLVLQGGMGLGGREDYIEGNPRAADIRTQYVRHVATMLRLSGESAESAEAGAAAVMRIETALARAAAGRVESRNPMAMAHKMRATELQALTPAFDWARYFRALGAPASDVMTVPQPEFFTALGRIVRETPATELRAYLRWHLLHANARALPAPFATENFHFYSTVRTGATEPPPRWRECVARTDMDLSDALGRAFVARTFSADAKADAREMVRRIKAVLEADISGSDWMSDATRRAALEKLHALIDKIGYPDSWRDYSALRIVRTDPLGNRLRASAFEMRRMVSTIGRPPDGGSWNLTPPTVNALTNFFQNSIDVPAGILQPPFYGAGRDPAVNYGGIGATIGHELTHGFDTQGRHFDAAGTIRDWWTPADARAFDERAACFVNEFSEFAVDGVSLNGRLTVGENISDAGGVRLALLAYVASGEAARSGVKDDFTPEQRVFIGYAQKHCQEARPEAAVNAARQPTPPGRFRVNGILSNMPEFQKAFTCAADAPMVRTPACRVW